MRIAIKTLGCRANRYESDKLFRALEKKYDVFELNYGFGAGRFGLRRAPDVLIVNTCTVTSVADRKSRQVVFGFKRLFPDCKIIVFGCGPNVSQEDYKKIKEINYLAKNSKEVLKIIEKIGNKKSLNKKSTESSKNAMHGFRSRALLKIQDGCNQYCTYCIVPRARGPELSFPSKEIIKEAQKLEREGYKEIVITGINIGQWKEKIGGHKKDIGDLLEMLIKNTKNVRIRISSIEPAKFSKKFFELFKNPRLCRHVHLCLQSGSDSVLKKMRRNYSTKEFADSCGKFRKIAPDIGITTDVIVGFPGETEKDFKETCDFVKKIGFLKVHIFPYSKRKNTVAYYMKNHIDPDVKKNRAKILKKIADQSLYKFKKSLIGKTYEVLLENPKKKGIYNGFTSNYVPVRILYAGKKNMAREYVKVKLTKDQVFF